MRVSALLAVALAAATPLNQGHAQKPPATTPHPAAAAPAAPVQPPPPAPVTPPPAAAPAPAPVAEPPPPTPPPAPPAPPPPPPPHVLTIAAIGTPFATQLHDSLALPFSAATGLPVEIQTADGGLEPLKAHAKPDDWDLAELTTADLTAACDAGLLEKIDWGAIGGRDHYAPMGVSDCGVGARVRSDILAWDKDKLPGLPTWGDFFDITKYPGKRGLHRDARGLLEIALMADGVAPGDVYRALGSGDGADRAFRKLDQLRPYIVWWKTGDDALKLLSSGEVLMTEAPYANVMLANRDDFRNFGIQPNFSIVTLDWWAVLKGATGARDAVQFLYFAGTPAIGGKLLDRFAVSVLVRGAYEFARPEAQVAAPLHPANLKNQIQIDEGFWRDNGAKLTARFEQWLEH